MVIAGLSQRTFGQIAKRGFQDLYVITEIKIATTSRRQEVAELEHKERKVVIIGQ